MFETYVDRLMRESRDAALKDVMFGNPPNFSGSFSANRPIADDVSPSDMMKDVLGAVEQIKASFEVPDALLSIDDVDSYSMIGSRMAELSSRLRSIRIRESGLMVETTIVARKGYKLIRKGKKRQWYPSGDVIVKQKTSPSRTIYVMLDGTIVCHPVVAAEIMRAVARA